MLLETIQNDVVDASGSIDETPHAFWYMSRVNVQITAWVPDQYLVPMAKQLAGFIRYSFWRNGCPDEEIPAAIRENIPVIDDGFWAPWAAVNQFNTKFLINVIFAVNRELKWRFQKNVDLLVLRYLNHHLDRKTMNTLFEKYVPEGTEPTVPPCPDGTEYHPSMGNLLEQWMICARDEWVDPVWTRREKPSWWEETDLAVKSVEQQIAEYEAQQQAQEDPEAAEENDPDDQDDEGEDDDD
jgi:hypothetical protein